MNQATLYQCLIYLIPIYLPNNGVIVNQSKKPDSGSR